MDVWVKGIGEKRGAPYVYFDGLQAVRAGFALGMRYDVQLEEGRVVLTINQDGSRTVSAKRKGEAECPVVDINNQDLRHLFEGMSAIRVVVTPGKVFLLPLASEIKKRERFQRIVEKTERGEPLAMGSVAHGGGILSHAIHKGLEQAGIKADLAFANEIRADLLQHAIEVNDAWNEGTMAINLSMQEAAQDDWLLSRLPKLDILEMGLPCSGASKAGVSKRGLAKMEDHPEVGHLVYAGLVILSKVQAALVTFENVPEYADSASAQILRQQLRDMGYQTHEALLSGGDFGCIENRVRWCMVAVTEGIDFSFDQLAPALKVVRRLGDYLDPISGDDPRFRPVTYLKAKELRDAENGNSFSMQMVSGDSTKIPTLRKGYAKGGSTDPRLLHPTDPSLSRLLTAREHARVKEVPEHLIAGLSETVAHQILGQGIVYEPFRAVGQRIGEAIQALVDVRVRKAAERKVRRKVVASFGIG